MQEVETCRNVEGAELGKKTKKLIRYAGMLLFVLYMGMMVYFLFFAESYGRTVEEGRGYQYNLELLAEIRRFWVYRDKVGNYAMALNIFGNVAAFVPFGCILPVIQRRFRNWLLLVISGFSFSLCVEVAQLVFRVGCFDVDDLLLNTLGALLGYGVFCACDQVRRRLDGKTL